MCTARQRVVLTITGPGPSFISSFIPPLSFFLYILLICRAPGEAKKFIWKSQNAPKLCWYQQQWEVHSADSVIRKTNAAVAVKQFLQEPLLLRKKTYLPPSKNIFYCKYCFWLLVPQYSCVYIGGSYAIIISGNWKYQCYSSRREREQRLYKMYHFFHSFIFWSVFPTFPPFRYTLASQNWTSLVN